MFFFQFARKPVAASNLRWSQNILPFFLILASLPPSLQVDIRLSARASGSPTIYDSYTHAYIDAVCPDIEPGKCCKIPDDVAVQIGPHGYMPSGQLFHRYRVAAITGLRPLDIAAVWQPYHLEVGCAGRPMDTRTGPGNWYFLDLNLYNSRWVHPNAIFNVNTHPGDSSSYGREITGTSYMRMPTKLPKKGL